MAGREPAERASTAGKVQDDLASPQERQRRSLRRKALDLVLTGQREVERINGSDVVRVGAKRAPLSRAELRRARAGHPVRPRTVDAYAQYYLASNRTSTSYDRYLRTGPDNFGFGASRPDRVEFFPYQAGLLVNDWDSSYTDDATSEHRGTGWACRSTRTRG